MTNDIWKEAEEWANKTLKTQPKNVNVQQTMEEACLHLAKLLDWNRKRLEQPVVHLEFDEPDDEVGLAAIWWWETRGPVSKKPEDGTYRKEQS